MTDRLGNALHDLVDDLPTPDAPPTAALWAGGARRRTRDRVLNAGVFTVVLALVAGAVWAALPGRSLTAPDLPGSSTSQPGGVRMPSFIARPWFDAPSIVGTGQKAAAAFDDAGEPGRVYLLGRDGVVYREQPGLSYALTGTQNLSVSPDGVWLARGPSLTSVLDGRIVGDPALADQWNPAGRPPLWAPDSSAALIVAVDQATKADGTEAIGRYSGLVLGIDGRPTPLPLTAPQAEGELRPFGWLDARTVIGYLNGDPATPRPLWTWRVGDAAWSPAPGLAPLTLSGLGDHEPVLSPDGATVFIQGPAGPDATGATSSTRLRVELRDLRTDRLIPLAGVGDDALAAGVQVDLGDRSLTCEPAWLGGQPQLTGQGLLSVGGQRPVEISERFGRVCLAPAGRSVAGVDETGLLARLADRLPALLLGAVLIAGLALWGRRRNRDGLSVLPARRTLAVTAAVWSVGWSLLAAFTMPVSGSRWLPTADVLSSGGSSVVWSVVIVGIGVPLLATLWYDSAVLLGVGAALLIGVGLLPGVISGGYVVSGALLALAVAASGMAPVAASGLIAKRVGLLARWAAVVFSAVTLWALAGWGMSTTSDRIAHLALAGLMVLACLAFAMRPTRWTLGLAVLALLAGSVPMSAIVLAVPAVLLVVLGTLGTGLLSGSARRG